jgi:APA family basic amino acid/polyamine antiporter
MAQAGVTLPFFAGDRIGAGDGSAVPVRATLFVSMLAVLMGLLGREALGPIVDIAAVPLLVVFALVCAGLIRLRRVRPDVSRPYRVPGGLLLPGLAFILSVGLVAAAGVTAIAAGGGAFQWGFMASWIVLGLLFWWRAAAHRRTLSVTERKRRVLQGEA